jgi:DNA-binding NarL/FixJ family response regulator
MRLLIADDNAPTRQLLRSLLETREGWQVCGEAENGIDAAAKAAELKPEFIILDLAMPLMDGIHTAKQISAACPNIPIVLYTMHRFAGLDLEAKKVGIRKVISKTAAAEELFLAIDEVLNAEAPRTASDLPLTAAQTNSNLSGGSNEPQPPAATGGVDANSKPN